MCYFTVLNSCYAGTAWPDEIMAVRYGRTKFVEVQVRIGELIVLDAAKSLHLLEVE